MKRLQTILFLTLFCACKNTNSSETPKDTTVEVDTLVQETVVEAEQVVFYATVDKLRLRKEANKSAAVVEQIKEGGKLFYLNEKTDKKEKIKLRNRWYEEPWLKVESEKGNEGWVYGGAITEVAPEEEVSKLPYDKCEAAFVKDRNYTALRKCYDKISEQQTKEDARYIRKTETGYQVTLLSGETRNLVDQDRLKGGENYRAYAYRYYLNKIGYFVFRIDRFEGGDYILLDDKFGYAMPIYGMPRLAPDLKKLVITNTDDGAGFEFNGIQLMEITDEGIDPEPLFEEKIEGFQPFNPVWEDERTVSFDFLSTDSERSKLKIKAKLSMNEEGEWNLSIKNRRD